MIDVHRLESWYIKHKRKLSFRDTKNPYFIWVSEIMLQQTQVDTVIPYFERWIKNYPTIEDVAKATLEDILKLVEGIGYYRRFRLLHQACQKIVKDFNSEFPTRYKDVISLPGVGMYTAGAIMSIAYNKPYSAVDGNVIRVLSRSLGIDLDMRLDKHKKMLDTINQGIIEQATPEIYTQALMELGAIICTPTKPLCDMCPLNKDCVAFQSQNIEKYPFMSKLKEKKMFYYITLVIEYQNGIVLRKRTESLLKDMYEYPQFQYENLNSLLSALEDEGIILEPLSEPKLFKHVFTHQIWHMEVYHLRLIKGLKNDWELIEKQQIKHKPMAIAHRKIR